MSRLRRIVLCAALALPGCSDDDPAPAPDARIDAPVAPSIDAAVDAPADAPIDAPVDPIDAPVDAQPSGSVQDAPCRPCEPGGLR
jgi:hypothetical protein